MDLDVYDVEYVLLGHFIQKLHLEPLHLSSLMRQNIQLVRLSSTSRHVKGIGSSNQCRLHVYLVLALPGNLESLGQWKSIFNWNLSDAVLLADDFDVNGLFRLRLFTDPYQVV